MMNGYGGIGGMGAGASLLMVLALVAVLLAAVWAVRELAPGTRGTARTEPVDLLKQRYAAGEISHDEYEQARRAIE
jgi:uncharacterized membrane protein